MKVSRGTIVLLCVILAGCETTQTAPGTVKEAVAEAPCKARLGPKPVYPADMLTGAEDIFTMGSVLWSDRLSRRARELELETTVEGCTRRND